MNKVLSFLVLAVLVFPVQGEVYKCPGANGVVRFTDKPCFDGHRAHAGRWLSVKREADRLSEQRLVSEKAARQRQAEARARAEEDKARQDALDSKYAGRVSEYALLPYGSVYTEIIAKFGKRLEAIQQFRKSAAYKVLDSGKCEFVEVSELSTSRSSLYDLNFWVDCRNGERIRFTESAIREDHVVRTEREKAWGRSSAIDACQRMIKAHATFPSRVDFHEFLGTSYYQSPDLNRNAVVRINFDAMNALGTEMPYSAACYFPPGEPGTIKISER